VKQAHSQGRENSVHRIRNERRPLFGKKESGTLVGRRSFSIVVGRGHICTVQKGACEGGNSRGLGEKGEEGKKRISFSLAAEGGEEGGLHLFSELGKNASSGRKRERHGARSVTVKRN